jgi:hypothetical protein
MAKARRGPALFELLGEDGGRVVAMPRLPRWWSAGRQAGDEPAAAPSPVAEAPAVEPLRPSNAPAQLLEISGDRVRVSLTSFSAGVAIFLVLAVLTAAYLVGSRSGDQAGFRRGYDVGRVAAASAPDEVTAARSQPPATHLLAPLAVRTDASAPRDESAKAKTAATPAPTASSTGWVKDLTYIVVQEFPASAAERAKNAQQFLAQRGVETEVVAISGGGVHLIGKQGYNHKDVGQKKLAEALLAKIRTIGGQYYAAGGGYKLEGYYKTLKRDTW